MPALLSLISVIAVSLVSLIGVFTLSMDAARLRRIATLFVSFAVGALLGDAFIHLIPKTFAGSGPTPLGRSLGILGGILIFFVVEKLLRHAHGPLHEFHHGHDHGPRPELAAINVFGDAIHNFIDGVLIGASYLTSTAVGISTTVAVLLHEIPQELGDFAILLHAGYSRQKALMLNVLSALASLAGTVGAFLAFDTIPRTLPYFLVIAASSFLYVAMADLIPGLHRGRTDAGSLRQIILIAIGIFTMVWFS